MKKLKWLWIALGVFCVGGLVITNFGCSADSSSSVSDSKIMAFGIAENEASIGPLMDNAAAHAEIDKVLQLISAKHSTTPTATEITLAMTYVAQQSYWLSLHPLNQLTKIPMADQELIMTDAADIHYANGMDYTDVVKRLTDAYTTKVPVLANPN